MADSSGEFDSELAKVRRHYQSLLVTVANINQYAQAFKDLAE